MIPSDEIKKLRETVSKKPREFWIAQGSHADIVCYTEDQAKKLGWSIPFIHVSEVIEEINPPKLLDAYSLLLEQNEKYKNTFLKITELGCLYRGDLTGCAGCIVCNEHPEFNEINKRKRNDDKIN